MPTREMLGVDTIVRITKVEIDDKSLEANLYVYVLNEKWIF